ncbi:MAG: M16 family metallopeptidase, partial [Acidobacteriota bacterium]
NATLIVAGDVKPEEVRDLAQAYFGPLAPSPGIVERVRPQEPPQLAERRLSFSDPRVAQPVLTRSYLAPERDPGDQKKAAALTILAELLGGDGQTSVLARALQFDKPVALYTSAYYDGTSYDDTTFNLAVVPAEGVSLAEVEAALDAVLTDFLAKGPDPKQFARIQTQIEAAQIYGKDDVEGLARKYGEGLASGLTIRDIQDWPAVLQSVTPADVVAAGREVLDRKRAVTGWMTRTAEGETTELMQ